MHFAAYAYVGESVEKPLMYYQNNVATTISVLECMQEAGVKRFVFSSTCAVYGDPDKIPITEDEKKAPVSPYGRSKLMVEQILQDMPPARTRISSSPPCVTSTPAAARWTARIGEDHDPETHLIPVILQAILGAAAGHHASSAPITRRRTAPTSATTSTSTTWPTRTSPRWRSSTSGQPIFCNLGTGSGFSVKEIIATVGEGDGQEGPGAPTARAAPAMRSRSMPIRAAAKQLLGWEAKHKDPETIIRSAWNWFSKHPKGYASK